LTARAIDVGFGDLVEPPPAQLTFPVLLPFDPPIVRSYPPETVIAEKFQAMVMLGIGNSRMKDFFDIWTLATTHNFRFQSLSRSVRQIFERRRTPVPTTAPVAFTEGFLLDENKQRQWKAFGNRSELSCPHYRASERQSRNSSCLLWGQEMGRIWFGPGRDHGDNQRF
jgi:hypothetical protein